MDMKIIGEKCRVIADAIDDLLAEQRVILPRRNETPDTATKILRSAKRKKAKRKYKKATPVEVKRTYAKRGKYTKRVPKVAKKRFSKATRRKLSASLKAHWAKKNINGSGTEHAVTN